MDIIAVHVDEMDDGIWTLPLEERKPVPRSLSIPRTQAGSGAFDWVLLHLAAARLLSTGSSDRDEGNPRK